MHPIIVLILSGWITVEGIKYITKSHKHNKIERENLERIHDLMRVQGIAEEEIKTHTYLTGLNRLENLSAEQDNENKETRMGLIQKQLERQERIEENEKKEERRIQRNYDYRPTVEEMINDLMEPIHKSSLDYLSIIITGNAGEFQFLKVPPTNYEKYRKIIEDDEYDEEIDYEFDINNQNIHTYFTEIYKFEIGSKSSYIHSEAYESVESDIKSFGEWIQSVTSLTGQEKDYLAIRYIHSKSHYLFGTVGLDYPINEKISKEHLNFHNTYFQVHNFRFKYDNFSGDFVDSLNSVYDVIVPISQLKTLKPDRIWG